MASAKRILLVDDEPDLRKLCHLLLSREGYVVDGVDTLDAAEIAVGEQVYDLVLADYQFPGTTRTGMDLLRFIRREDPTLPLIMITGKAATISDAVAAMQAGAFSYLSKPFEPEELIVNVQKGIEQSKLARELRRLRAEVQERRGFDGIIGRSKPIRDLFSLVRRVAPSDSTVLISGESGTGKELVARAIHDLSARSGRAFVAINCAVLPEPLLESELFGHAKGAFTGAYRAKKGLFEEASGGTLFLDEISDISPAVQAKLLRVLQDKEVRAVGSTQTSTVDVRVIAATNAPLDRAMTEGRFRPDLYFRLAVVPVALAPLRDRREDIPLLADHFLRRYCAHNRVGQKTFTDEAIDVLSVASWPGNVRQLENAIERTVVTCEGAVIRVSDLPPEVRLQVAPFPKPGDAAASVLKSATAKAAAEVERQSIVQALRGTAGNKSKAAALLGISRGSLYNKMRGLGIEG